MTLRMKIKASAVALALASLPLAADAAGLGKITVLSVLGQPLRAEIDITASREETPTLAARIASYDAFRQAGIEYVSVLSSVRVSVAKRPDGRPYLLLKSDQAVNEPFLDLLLEMSWAAGRMQREYTFLLDPPEALQKQAPQASPVAVPLAAPVAPIAPVAPPEQTSTRAAAPEQEPAVTTPSPAPAQGKKSGNDMKVVRSANGVQRIVKAAPPEAPETEATTHQVKRGDTLGKIAAETLPDGVNLDQMLVALFRSNKDAFDGGNINRLKAGKILAIPDQATVAAIGAKEARDVVIAQSADFAAYRKKLAAATEAAPVTREEAPKQAASGKIEPKVQETAPAPATGKDKLEVSKSAAAKSASEKSAAARTAAIEEDLIAREKSLKEANTRIAALDKNLADMKKVLEIKSQNMAEAQKHAQAAPPAAPAQAPAAEQKPAPAPAATPAPIQTPPPVAEPVAAEKPAEPATEKPAEAAPPVETAAAKPAEPKPAAAKPAPKIVAAAPPPPPAEEPSFIDGNPELVLGGGGVVALLLGFLGFKQWRKRKEAAAKPREDMAGPNSQSEPSINSVFGGTGGQLVDTGSTAAISSLDTDFSVAGVGGTDTNEGVDPIAEADVYMAYGRNAQAEEILLDALKNEPARHAIHLKLLEIYAARKSLKQFETIAYDLHDQTGGSGEEWDQAAEIGRSIDPDNSLYSEASAGITPTPHEEYNPAATMVMTPQDFDRVAAGFGPEGIESAATTTVVPEPPFEEVPESLDFELDLGGDSVQGEATTDEDLALDLDLGSDEPPLTPALAETADTQAVDDHVIDFEIEMPALSAESSQHNAEISLEMPEPSIEDPGLEFDLGEPKTAVATEASPLAAAGIDLSSISLDLDEPPRVIAGPKLTLEDESIAAPLEIPPLSFAAATLAEPLTASAPPTAGSAAETTETAADDTPGSPEVDTKLELASAYEEMGDKDGARELLQEVLKEGNATQKATARSKLEQLG